MNVSDSKQLTSLVKMIKNWIQSCLVLQCLFLKPATVKINAFLQPVHDYLDFIV